MSMSQFFVPATLACALGLAAGSASAASFTPTSDGITRVFGGDFVDTTNTLLGISQSGGLANNAIFEFDLSAIANNATITSASITFTQTRFISPTHKPSQVDIFTYLGDGMIDISDFDATGTQVVDETVAGGGTGGDTISFNFTDLSDIQSALAADLLTVRFETDSFSTIQIASLENTTYDAAVLDIQFSVSAVPLPASLPLALGGVAILGALRTRKSRA